MSRIHLITYENAEHAHLNNLRKSAAYFGWPEITVLGKDQTWKGFGTKTFACTKYLKTLPPDDIAIVVDARDVLVNGTPADFLEKFQTLSTALLVSAEWGCCAPGEPQITPEVRLWVESKADTPNRYLNAGMIAGRVSVFQSVYPFGVKYETDDDQNAMIHYWYTHPDKIVLDYGEELFSNATWSPNEDGYRLENGCWTSKVSGTAPIFIQTAAKNWRCYNTLLSLYSSSNAHARRAAQKARLSHRGTAAASGTIEGYSSSAAPVSRINSTRSTLQRCRCGMWLILLAILVLLLVRLHPQRVEPMCRSLSEIFNLSSRRTSEASRPRLQ